MITSFFHVTKDESHFDDTGDNPDYQKGWRIIVANIVIPFDRCSLQVKGAISASVHVIVETHAPSAYKRYRMLINGKIKRVYANVCRPNESKGRVFHTCSLQVCWSKTAK